MPTVIVTGAYGAIGKAIAEGVAEKGFRLVMLGRDQWALEEARKKLINKIGNEQVEIHALDLSRESEICSLANEWEGPLHLLINNAAATPRTRLETAYRQTKQADRMLTAAFARRLQDKHIAVLAAHPGDVNSKLSNNLGYGGWESPEQGATTPLFCATDPTLKGWTGKYFEHRKETPCPFAADPQSVEKLFELCESYCRMPK